MATPLLGIRELAEQAREHGAYDLAQGIIDAEPPKVFQNALAQIPIQEVSRYNDKRGLPSFRDAICEHLASLSWKVSLSSIMGTCGVVGGMTAVLLADLRPGDRAILLEPFFIGHKLILDALGFEIDYIPVPLNEQPDWQLIEKKMANKTALIISTPANPTGQIAPSKTLIKLSKVAAKKSCLLLIDEVYRDFIWDDGQRNDRSHNKLNLDNTVIFRSFSKTLAIPGWRVGYAVTNPERIERMASQHDALYIGGSTIVQYVLAGVLLKHSKEVKAYVEKLRKQLTQNKERLTQAFTDYGMEPVLPVPGAYYMMIKHNRRSDAAAAQELLKKKIVVTPANILYSNPQKNTSYIRIHFAVSEETAKKVSEILTR